VNFVYEYTLQVKCESSTFLCHKYCKIFFVNNILLSCLTTDLSQNDSTDRSRLVGEDLAAKYKSSEAAERY